MKKVFLLLVAGFFFPACGSDDDATTPGGSQTNADAALLKIAQGKVTDADGKEVMLQGVCFNNWHWIESPLPPNDHHSEIDFQRVASMGMNVVRFNLNYWIFEDDATPYQYKQTAWDWLDENIQWAKNHGVYLILNMHTPQGGHQSQGTGDALWSNVENQNRLVALWRAIAERYKEEPQIAGYGIVNEPVPTQSMNQWSLLAQRLIDEIRTIDNHLIFVEQAIFVEGATEPDSNLNFPRVSGENIVYEFHTYEPFLYTHQNLAFANLGDGGNYPDMNIVQVNNPQWHTAIFNNPTLTQNADWAYFEGIRYQVNDVDSKIGLPIALVANIGNGRVFFDDLVIKEYDANGSFIRDVATHDFDSLDGWAFWSRDGGGNTGVSQSGGTNGDGAAYITGVADEGNIGSGLLRFEPVQGNSYEISGWMRAENLPANAEALFRIDFYNSDEPVYRRNKAYLEANINRVINWANQNGAILYVGEVGAGAPCFENGKGGLEFVRDITDIMGKNNLHFTYFDYHSDTFGLYRGFGSLPNPSNVNQSLIDLFADLLK
ncbi:MAG: glycoside hydrolase family 5 protein [Flavobacteriaceae bacterium]